MTGLQLLITIVCGAGALALSFWGAYWLGGRNAARAIAREEIDETLGGILAELDDDEEDGGVEVLARA